MVVPIIISCVTQRQRQVHTLDQMSKEWEVDHPVTLQLLLAFYYVLFTSVSQVDFSERIVSGGQDLFWAFLPKWITRQIREQGREYRGATLSSSEGVDEAHICIQEAHGSSSCGQWLMWSSKIDTVDHSSVFLHSSKNPRDSLDPMAHR